MGANSNNNSKLLPTDNLIPTPLLPTSHARPPTIPSPREPLPPSWRPRELRQDSRSLWKARGNRGREAQEPQGRVRVSCRARTKVERQARFGCRGEGQVSETPAAQNSCRRTR